jgi:hypothetical protein
MSRISGIVRGPLLQGDRSRPAKTATDHASGSSEMLAKSVAAADQAVLCWLAACKAAPVPVAVLANG